MKLFLAGLGTETNTFLPIASGWNHWLNTNLAFRAEGVVELAGKPGWQLTFRPMTGANFAGITPRQVYESQRSEISNRLPHSRTRTCFP